MSGRENSKCLIHLGGNRYRCRNRGIEFEATALPIWCCGEGPHKPPPSRGLGDTVAKVTRFFGVKPCGGCKKRQAALNRWWPYR